MDQTALIANWKCTLVNENSPLQYNAEQPTYYASAITAEKPPTVPGFNVSWVLGVFLFVSKQELFDLQLLGTVCKFKAEQILLKKRTSFTSQVTGAG